MFRVDPRGKAANSPREHRHLRNVETTSSQRRTHQCETASQQIAGLRARGSRAIAGLPVRIAQPLRPSPSAQHNASAVGPSAPLRCQSRPGPRGVQFHGSLDPGINFLRYVTLHNGRHRVVSLAPPGAPASAAAATRHGSLSVVGVSGASRLFGGHCRGGCRAVAESPLSCSTGEPAFASGAGAAGAAAPQRRGMGERSTILRASQSAAPSTGVAASAITHRGRRRVARYGSCGTP